MRINNRKITAIRPIKITPNIIDNADGSCMIEIGKTRVICTASIENRVPFWLKNTGKGWITAEYGMLPRSTNQRMSREAKSGKQTGRTQEIQRLIGRSIRACVDLEKIPEKQIVIDCDVIEADGGTRTASITGAWLALKFCVEGMMKQGLINKSPIKSQIAAISCGILNGQVLIDLDYEEDSAAEVDANFVFTSDFELIEVQSTGEERTFKVDDLNKMLDLVKENSHKVFEAQKKAI
ncbi:MAG: ribonuclease PH [Rhodobiaceae bacterium]|nr:ribonuclease PH [Rhodobiaceae bacterium]|tara:strand:- start:14510 stop:15220 length:711 start_codon:yes stop_codon:yes gene_type:complete